MALNVILKWFVGLFFSKSTTSARSRTNPLFLYCLLLLLWHPVWDGSTMQV